MGGKWGFIDKENKVVVSLIYERVYSFSDGLALIMEKGRNAYFIDKFGEINIALKRSYTLLEKLKFAILSLAVATVIYMLIKAIAS